MTIIVATGVTITIMLVGVLFFWLHSLPERLAHRAHKLQIELIAVLCLLSLFTHVHAFWVAALVLAFIKIPEVPVPDVMGSLDRIARAIDGVAATARKTVRTGDREGASASSHAIPVAKQRS